MEKDPQGRFAKLDDWAQSDSEDDASDGDAHQDAHVDHEHHEDKGLAGKLFQERIEEEEHLRAAVAAQKMEKNENGDYKVTTLGVRDPRDKKKKKAVEAIVESD